MDCISCLWLFYCFLLMVKSIVSCSWLMAMTRLVSMYPSCAPRLASCPRSLSCLTAASQRTSSTGTTHGKLAWMRSSPPPRKHNFTTLSYRFLRYCGHIVCNVCGEWGVDLKLGLLCPCSQNVKGEQVNRGRDHKQNKGIIDGLENCRGERGWYIFTHWGWWGTQALLDV